MNSKMKDAKNEQIEEMIRRFLLNTATDEEKDLLTEWIKENPEENQTIFDAQHTLWVREVMAMPAPKVGIRGWMFIARRKKIGRYAASIAASLLLGFGANHILSVQRVTRIANAQTTIEVPAGHLIRFTLADGSVVDLNSGSSLSYPTAFTGKERRVKLSGEAIFEVTADANKPFVVETFAADVTALGTRFNVISDEEHNEFSTALFDGKVSVSPILSNEYLVLAPNMMVSLHGGKLMKESIKNMDEYRWVDGILSLSDLPFDKLVERLEKAFDVQIVLKRPTPPAINYGILKVRVTDGVAHAMNMLQRVSNFTYEYDSMEKTITIK